MKTANEWFIEQAQIGKGASLSMRQRIELTRAIQIDALKSAAKICEQRHLAATSVAAEYEARDCRDAILALTKLPKD